MHTCATLRATVNATNASVRVTAANTTHSTAIRATQRNAPIICWSSSSSPASASSPPAPEPASRFAAEAPPKSVMVCDGSSAVSSSEGGTLSVGTCAAAVCMRSSRSPSPRLIASRAASAAAAAAASSFSVRMRSVERVFRLLASRCLLRRHLLRFVGEGSLKLISEQSSIASLCSSRPESGARSESACANTRNDALWKRPSGRSGPRAAAVR